MKQLVSVYKSPKKDEMYLYTLKGEQLTRVPKELKGVFGSPVHVLDMLLTPQRQLARVDSARVLQCLQAQGYYLQMPPAPEPYIEQLPDELLRLNDPT